MIFVRMVALDWASICFRELAILFVDCNVLISIDTEADDNQSQGDNTHEYRFHV